MAVGVTCIKCHGKSIADKKVCPKCHGSGQECPVCGARWDVELRTCTNVKCSNYKLKEG